MSFPQRGFFWTDKATVTLKTLWTAGKSAREIAEVLGKGVTRNAVIGRVFRLTHAGKLAPRPKDKSGPRLAKVVRPPKAPATVRMVAPPKPLPEPARAPILFDVSQFRTVTILTMGARDCKFDMGGEGADALFCGEPKHGHHFCRHHTRIGVDRVKEAMKRLPDNSPQARGTKLTGLGLRTWGMAG